jgi:AcrR family transcriptional regulator
MVNKSRGRPPGNPDTRGRLVAAARERFLAVGYAETSLRSVARDAGVDPSLLNYHFGSKEGLFGAVMALTLSPSRVVSRVLDGGGPLTGAAILGAALDTWDHPEHGAPLVTLVREVGSSPEVRRAVAGYLGDEVVGRLAERLGGREATKRAGGVGTVLAGLVFCRYVLELEPLASMPRAEVVRLLAPAVDVQLRPARGR